MSVDAVSDAVRAREALRYEAPSIATTAPLDPAQPLAPQLNPAFVPDPVLTSLAQLAAVRLEATGAFISVFDLRYQHVLAQATRSSNIRRREHVSEDCPLLGMAIPRSSSFCEHALVAADRVKSPPDELPISVIPDLTARSSSDLPRGIVGLPDTRFYAAIAIKSPRGPNIGVLSVHHDQTKNELSADQLRCLRDLSLTITDHLQTKQGRVDLRRSERMVRGLGSFVEGSTSMSFNLKSSNISSFRDEGTEGALNTAQQDGKLQENPRSMSDSTPRASPMAYQREYGEGSPAPLPSFESNSQTALPDNPRPESSSTPSQEGRSLGQLKQPTQTVSATLSEAAAGEENHMSHVRPLFSRAANIIRESIEVEGVVFVDASSSSFGGLVGMDDSSSTSLSTHSSSEENLTDLLDGDSKCCNLLGFSTGASSSLGKDTRTSNAPRIPQKFLRTLLRRYPGGKIFNYCQDWPLLISSDSSGNEAAHPRSPNTTERSRTSSSEESSKPPEPSRKWSKQKERASLRNILPDATSIMIIPLWDTAKQRWYAGGIVWTCQPSRIFTQPSDISYLKAFSTSVLAELSRLETLIVERSKTDALGSLSHELRSPLHGIIAAVDLLHDTSLDAFQSDVVHSMESCGRVLLDVLNHLLDYSKVNTLLRSAKSQKGWMKGNDPAQHNQQPLLLRFSSLSTYVPVDSLLEESIDSVFAGHIYQKLSIFQLGQDSSRNTDALAMRTNDAIDAIESFGSGGPSGKMKITLGDVIVLVDIDPNASWDLKTEPGAFRRIVLNLVGNSLRYTSQGHITISLKQEKLPSKSQHRGTNMVLVISDTGRGIGAHFMKHQLFIPFTQEDRFSPGTGLGLSLVKQITKTLKGSVTVESQVGVGTCIRVTIPVSSSGNESEAGTSFDKQKITLSGMRVSLVGLDERPPTMLATSRPSPHLSEAEVLQRICSEWLSLQIVKLDDEEYRPDLILCSETAMSDLLKASGKRRLSAPIIVICRDAIAAHQHNKFFSSITGHRVLEFVTQPIGPRKLAKSLEAALNRWAEAVDADRRTSESEVRYNPSPALEVGDRSIPDRNKLERTLTEEIASDATSVTEIGDARHNQLSESIEDESAKANVSQVTAEPSPPSPVSIESPKGKDILLVDDNNINLRILVSYMKKRQRSFQTATNGLEALQAFKANPTNFSCILMDLSMPVMGGLEATRRIRAFERSNNIQPPTTIIALTGLASSDTQQEAFASGLDLYLTKPVKLQILAQILDERRI